MQVTLHDGKCPIREFNQSRRSSLKFGGGGRGYAAAYDWLTICILKHFNRIPSEEL